MSSFPRPFRIEVKPLIRRFTLTVEGLIASLISARLKFSCAFRLPFLSRTAKNGLIQPFLPFGRDVKGFPKKNFFFKVKGLPSRNGEFAKNNAKKIFSLTF